MVFVNSLLNNFKNLHIFQKLPYIVAPHKEGTKTKERKKRKMGFAKYTEDNIEIMEERFYFHSQSPLYETSFKMRTIIQPKRKTKIIICCECSKTFKFTGGEQKYYETHELSEPKRCHSCRKARNQLSKEVHKRKENQI